MLWEYKYATSFSKRPRRPESGTYYMALSAALLTKATRNKKQIQKKEKDKQQEHPCYQ